LTQINRVVITLIEYSFRSILNIIVNTFI